MRPWRNRRCQVLLIFMLWLSSIIVLYMYLTNDESVNFQNESLELLWWTDNIQFDYDEARQCGIYFCHVSNNRKRLQQSQVS